MKKLLRYWLYASLGLGAVMLLIAGAAYVYNQTLTPEERAEAAKRYEEQNVEKIKQEELAGKMKAAADLGTHDTEAYVVAKDFVKKRLNYPDEADFPWTPTSSKHRGGGVYDVIGEVTAKNAYGVKSTHSWRAVIKFLGGDDLNTKNWQEIGVEVAK